MQSFYNNGPEFSTEHHIVKSNQIPNSQTFFQAGIIYWETRDILVYVIY